MGFFFADSAVSYVSTLNISRMVTPKPIDHNFFWKKNKKTQLNNTFQVHLNGCCHQQKNKKWAIFDTFITITLGVNDPVLLICFLNSIWYISFLHFKTFQNQFHGVLLCIVFWYNIFCSQFDTNIVSIPWTKPSNLTANISLRKLYFKWRSFSWGISFWKPTLRSLINVPLPAY